MTSLFQKEFTVSSFDLDPLGQARLTTMANYFQEVATHHANDLGFGYDDMKNRNTMWLLSRMRIQIDSYPVWGEKIRLETWPSGVEKLFAVRDFKVLNNKGEKIGAASTYWLIVDVDSHRPLRPKAELETYASIDYGDPIFGTSMEKIGLPEGMHELNTHSVSFSDLDIMGHTNNVKYMEWCIDSAVSAGSHGLEIRNFEINFMKETKLGDVVTIYGDTPQPSIISEPINPIRPNHLLFNGIRKEDEVEVFRVKIEFARPSAD